MSGAATPTGRAAARTASSSAPSTPPSEQADQQVQHAAGDRDEQRHQPQPLGVLDLEDVQDLVGQPQQDDVHDQRQDQEAEAQRQDGRQEQDQLDQPGQRPVEE